MLTFRAAILAAACSLGIVLAAPASAQLCSPGQYSPTGSAPCYSCAPGSFSPAPGSVACNSCLVGYYNPSFGAAACNSCPDGSIAPFPGSTSCQACPPGYTSDPTHAFCVPLATPTKPRTWGRLKIAYR